MIARRALATTAGLLLLSLPAAAQDVQLESERTRWRFTFEQVDVEAPDEDLGLVGFHYDLLELFPSLPALYLGLGGYTALWGERGGFFLGGVTLGYLQDLGAGWAVDAGVFAGGGGGGGGSTASGLALRPFVGLERELGLLGLRLELAWFDLDDTEIEDLHLALGFTLPSEILVARRGSAARALADDALVRRVVRATPRYALLDPRSGATRKDGSPARTDADLIGLGIDTFLTPHLFVPVDLFGAAQGGYPGFAMALTGLGVAVPVWGEHVSLQAKAEVGAGGGSGVDTGGGFLWSATGGVSIRLSDTLALEGQAGLVDFPDGDFGGALYAVGLTWSSAGAGLALDHPRSALAEEAIPRSVAAVTKTRFELVNKTYVPESDTFASDGGELEDALNLIGLRVERPVYGPLALWAAAYTAWEGDVGGYAEGLLGISYRFHAQGLERHAFVLSGGIGAAGGGGLDVGSGLVYQASAGWRYALDERWFLSVDIGGIDSDNGTFEAGAFQVGIGWSLPTATLR